MIPSTIRITATILTTLLGVASASAGVIPPLPRIPAAALEAVSPTDAVDPAAIAERIAKNAKSAVDRLAANDPGTDTRKTQSDILRDIDALLKQAENPPNNGGGGGDSTGQNDNSGGGSSGGGGGQAGGASSAKSGSPPPRDNGGSSKESQSGGGSAKEKGSKPNQDGPSGPGSPPGQSKPTGPGEGTAKAGPSPGEGKSQNGPGTSGKPDVASKTKRLPDWRKSVQANRTGEPKREPASARPGDMDPPPMIGSAGPTMPGFTGTPPKPDTLKPEEVLAKQAWGHLPERLRQQMSQYYREQFSTRYGNLLQQYYSSLAEREKSNGK